jgi:hypothetical protein
MIRKFTRYLLMSAISYGAISCQDDEIVTPPKPSFQADKTSAEVGEEITFTIARVNADAVSLLPYGLPGGDPGVLVTFDEGTATVNFAYARPGTFQAIVVANNHTGDGESLKNVQSDPITITITSSKSAIRAFSFADISTETEIDEDAKTIVVTVPHGTNVTNLKASFTASAFSTVTVDGVAQTSGTTENDFSSPKMYTVTANNGTTSEYTVTVNVTPVETTNTIASITAKAVSESADDKELTVYLDNTTRTIVIYDTLDTPSTQFDSIQIGYDLDGEFAILKYGGKVLEQHSVLDLTSMQEFEVYSQDSTNAGGIQTYSVYAVAAPKLGLSFTGLNPDPAAAAEPTNFSYDINVLSGTDASSINTVTTIDAPVGVSVTSVKVDGVTFVSGTEVDYSEPVEFELTVNDTNLGVTYPVKYAVTVTVVP